MEFCTTRLLKLTLEALWSELQVNKWDYDLWISIGFTEIKNDYWSKCPMVLYWLNFWFVYFDHRWNKIFQCWYLKCFILACKRSTNQIWHFFQITFQPDSCFSPFWTNSWKQKVENVLRFPCANWNKPKSEPFPSRERPSREISQGSCLWENIFFSLYSTCDHQAVAETPNRCPQ